MLLADCDTCRNVGWICCHTKGPADLDGNGCCATDGLGCKSCDGCRDCDRAMPGEQSIRDDVLAKNAYVWASGRYEA